MDMIEFIRLGLIVFNGIVLIILAMHPTQEDVADYESWIYYHDKAIREGVYKGNPL